jgi:hypothetical protein
MARVTEEEIGIARRMAAEAKTLHQLRQSQAILLPALTGATFDTAYAALGLQEGAGGGIALDGGRQDEYRRDELLSATGWPSPSGSACSDGARRGHLAQGESPGQTGQRKPWPNRTTFLCFIRRPIRQNSTCRNPLA